MLLPRFDTTVVQQLEKNSDTEQDVAKRAKERVLENLEGLAARFNNAQYRNDARFREKISTAGDPDPSIGISDLKRAVPAEGLEPSGFPLPELDHLLRELPDKESINSILNFSPINLDSDLEFASKTVIDWLRAGMEIHASSTNSSCTFCTEDVSDDRLQVLREALDSETSKVRDRGAHLATQIRSTLTTLDEVRRKVENLRLGDPAHQDQLKEASGNFAKINKAYEDRWLEIVNKLDLKIEDLAQNSHVAILPEELQYPNELRNVLTEYDGLVEAQAERRSAAIEKVENRILSDFKKELSDARHKTQRIARCILALGKCIQSLKVGIEEVMQQQSDTTEMAQRITEDLQAYGGLSAIEITPTADGKFYQVRRSNGSLAENLSDGERNLLTFFYFLRSLEDVAVDPKRLIVVIDDPMTSLDAENFHVLTQMISHRWTSWEQTIVSTHNNAFFYELLGNVPDSATTRDELLVLETFGAAADEQKSPLWGMRPANDLKLALTSEYHYAFWCTAQAAAGLIDDIFLPSFGNAARRLLEGFSSFKRPATPELRQSLESAWASNPDLSKMAPALQSALSFANAHSHDRAPVPREKSWAVATERDFALTLYVIYALDRDHFEQMLRTFPDRDNLHFKVERVLMPYKGAYRRAQNGVPTGLEKTLDQ